MESLFPCSRKEGTWAGPEDWLDLGSIGRAVSEVGTDRVNTDAAF